MPLGPVRERVRPEPRTPVLLGGDDGEGCSRWPETQRHPCRAVAVSRTGIRASARGSSLPRLGHAGAVRLDRSWRVVRLVLPSADVRAADRRCRDGHVREARVGHESQRDLSIVAARRLRMAWTGKGARHVRGRRVRRETEQCPARRLRDGACPAGGGTGAGGGRAGYDGSDLLRQQGSDARRRYADSKRNAAVRGFRRWGRSPTASGGAPGKRSTG